MRLTAKPGRLELLMDASMAGKTVSDFLDMYLISSGNRYRMKTEETLLLNHVPVKDEQTVLHAKDVITILIKHEEPGFMPADEACDVIYEDDLVYVVHKDAGIIIHETDRNDTLASMAARWQNDHGLHVPVRYIHRLDKDTSGLVLFVKVPFFQAWFDDQLQKKKIRRHYMAVCTGKAKKGQKFTFDQPIGKDRHVSGKYRVSETGKPAVTKAECLDTKNGFLLMGCELETGRTHQIRVHLSHSRHPIVNDPLYGVPSVSFRNMCLWADRMEFRNPVDGELISVSDRKNPDYEFFGKS
ncbi:MAG: RluA family pseudouridine synthase [Solobacterium sp.]|nr:RluA family pseudouridine synthase [Solobacterium sp.]